MPRVDNKLVAKNTILLYIRMFLMMAISLYTSRLVLRILGVEDYGIYNVVGGIVTIFTFISGAMIAATQRFLNYYIGKDDSDKLKKVFNASIVIHFFIALIVAFFCETIGLWFLINKMTIPLERMDAAFWTFQFSIVATCFVIMSYPFNAAIIAHEKMGAFAYVSIFEAILKVLMVFVLGIINFDRLIVYAIFYMILKISITLIYRIYCLRYFTETKFCICGIPKSMYKEILSFSGWNFLGNIANVCLMQGTNILLNLFFGPSVNAAKGISLQVQNTVNQFCTNFQLAQNPQIVKMYAANELSEMHKLVFRSSRFSFYLVLLFSVPIIMKSKGILCLWLGDFPDQTAVFVQYTMLFILVQSLANPLLTSSLATGNVKRLMSVVATLFCCIIPLGYWALYLGYPPIVIFQIQLLLYIVAHILRIIIVSRQINFSLKNYWVNVLLPIMIVGLVSFLMGYILSCLFDNSFIEILIYSIASIILTIIGVFVMGVSKSEREKIINFINKKIRNA